MAVDDWATEAFTKGLNPKSLLASFKLKESLIEFEATMWVDVYNWHESKIQIEDENCRTYKNELQAKNKMKALKG